ncbi:hypothetical protein I8751_01270 [Nostocaceae cyanobacterium CENA357]|uniref:Uncharacterized protein n=1 Tax=Atlanticothrix silvestris CENA357 TaxID=1725252 RepID=A0A8J7L178_9CYAN|nr:hypothetical protein [Atlanticothrix silvestris]MBH8551042.1 hypothetical protein [Atlanticothrix silvestris CENA357]
MAKIVISDLHQTDVNMFLHDLHIMEMNTILGGFLQGLLGGYSDSLLATMYDSLNQSSNSTKSLAGVDENKIFTVDFSEIAFNFIVV